MRSSFAPPFALTALLFVLPSCTSTPLVMDASMDAGRLVGAPCSVDGDCVSGTCLASEHVCTGPCTSDAECGGGSLVCGINACAAPEGCAMCVPQCGISDFTCVDGVSTACSLVEADGPHCLDCGCGTPTDHCRRDVGCFPPGPVGDPCVNNRDCMSGSCSTFAGVCRVAVGQTCDATNCDSCLTLPSGARYCSRECRTPTDCRGGPCVGSASLGVLECRPATCTGSGCTVERAVRPAGQSCRLDTDCESGNCFSAQRCVGADCIGEGWCSAPCTTSADCGEGTSCVEIPCADGQTEGCGNVCLHSCVEFLDCGVYGGTCSALVTPERTLASVCDVRRDDGRQCSDSTECLSANCASGFCAP